jgi:hypothetical protein
MIYELEYELNPILEKDTTPSTFCCSPERHLLAKIAAWLPTHEEYYDARNNAGQTSLHLAVRHGHAGMVHLLLGVQANWAVMDENGKQALYYSQRGAEWVPSTPSDIPVWTDENLSFSHDRMPPRSDVGSVNRLPPPHCSRPVDPSPNPAGTS